MEVVVLCISDDEKSADNVDECFSVSACYSILFYHGSPGPHS